MKIYFASDHAGFKLKNVLIAHAGELGHEIEDMGPFEYDANDDYPEYVTPCANKVANADPGRARGVLLGKTGQGEAMCANRIHGARALVYYGGNKMEIPKLAREHNDANIISFAAEFLSEDEAKRALETFLTTEFSQEEKHMRRLAKF